MIEFIVIVLGLVVFETISSVDNAIMNAHVLRTLPEKYRKIFLFWGIIFAVFVVRGILPFIIVWIANPGLNIAELFSAVFSSGSTVSESLEESKPLLLLGGGMYLFMVFLAWIFLEEKHYAFGMEKFVHRQSMWFYAFASIFFTSIIYFSVKTDPILALSAAIGSTAFFITDGFKKNAEEKEQELLGTKTTNGASAWSKILYLEFLDASFSIDGVVGAFAFTTSVVLILIGNGIGAIVVRQLTMTGIDKITRFAYLKNGAMYSVGILGGIMVWESFGHEFPFWFAPVSTFALLAFFLYRSLHHEKNGLVRSSAHML